MGLFNHQPSAPDSRYCGHPDQRSYEHTKDDGTKETVAYCPSCGMEWKE